MKLYSTMQTTCAYCGARSFTATCPNGQQHEVTQHNEGVCPRWYDVGGSFEDGYCSFCPPPPARGFDGPNPFD